MGKIKAARIENSPRLRRLLGVLSDGQKHSTLELIQKAGICSVNSAADELRDPINGSLDIRCERDGKVWYYQLHRGSRGEPLAGAKLTAQPQE